MGDDSPSSSLALLRLAVMYLPMVLIVVVVLGLASGVVTKRWSNLAIVASGLGFATAFLLSWWMD